VRRADLMKSRGDRLRPSRSINASAAALSLTAIIIAASRSDAFDAIERSAWNAMRWFTSRPSEAARQYSSSATANLNVDAPITTSSAPSEHSPAPSISSTHRATMLMRREQLLQLGGRHISPPADAPSRTTFSCQ
jgi:hypothetical protein